jgi:hypothetical protein
VEDVLAGMCECDEETFRKYADRILSMISFLEFDVVRSLLARSLYVSIIARYPKSLSFLADRSFGKTG